MPVPIAKLESIIDEEVIVMDSELKMTKKKRSTKAFFVAVRNGKPLTALCDSYERAVYAAGLVTTEQYNVQKLHPVIDRDLIKKMNLKVN